MNKRIPFLLGLILLAFAIWLQITNVGFFHSLIIRLDNVTYDMQLRTKLLNPKQLTNSTVAIVDIDDKSLKEIGRWPWSRDKLGRLLLRLQEEGVAVIAMDMMFPESEQNIADTILKQLEFKKIITPELNTMLKKITPQFNNDAILANDMADKDIVLGLTFLPRPETSGFLPPPSIVLKTPDEQKLEFISLPGYISNISILQTAAKDAGFINVFTDPDGIIRRVPLLMRYKNNLYPSLALSAVKLFLLTDIRLVTATYSDFIQVESVHVGDHVIPTDAQTQMLIPFKGKSYTYPYYSASDVLNKKLPLKALEGKIVFVGTSATGLGDLRATAIEGTFPGVEIQATIADSILKNQFSYRPAWTVGAEITITIVVGLIFLFLFSFLGPRLLALSSILIPLCLFLLNKWLWEKTGLVLFVLIPALLIIALAVMNMVHGYLFETRRRERLKEMFGQYVPETHIDEMLKASGTYTLLGEDRQMTVLFADIRNFTSISEPMAASELKEMLNEFFTPMTEIIFNHHGTIDKYIGDLIMAFWGAPLKDQDHAEHALGAALDMQIAVEKLKPAFVERGWAEINIGIGLNSGIMSVGDMGSKFRRNYTVLGDAVNLGSRLEGLTSFYGVKIIASEATTQSQPSFVFRQLDRVRVKGKKSGINIYEVICRTAEQTEETKNQIQLSDQALDNYFKQEWDLSYQIFNRLNEMYPAVKMYSLYLNRIIGFKENPPSEEWDGVYAHAAK